MGWIVVATLICTSSRRSLAVFIFVGADPTIKVFQNRMHNDFMDGISVRYT